MTETLPYNLHIQLMIACFSAQVVFVNSVYCIRHYTGNNGVFLFATGVTETLPFCFPINVINDKSLAVVLQSVFHYHLSDHNNTSSKQRRQAAVVYFVSLLMSSSETS